MQKKMGNHRIEPESRLKILRQGTDVYIKLV